MFWYILFVIVLFAVYQEYSDMRLPSALGGWSGIVLSIVCLALITVGIWALQVAFQSETTAGDTFLTALRDEANHTAFELCDPQLQVRFNSSLGLRDYLDQHQLRPQQWRISQHYTLLDNQGAGPQIGVVAGTVTFRDGQQGSFRLDLVKINFLWRVEAFRLERVEHEPIEGHSPIRLASRLSISMAS